MSPSDYWNLADIPVQSDLYTCSIMNTSDKKYMSKQVSWYTYVKVGKLPFVYSCVLLNSVYVTVLYTALTISNEEMC